MNSSEQYLDSLLQGTVMADAGKDSGMERIAALQNMNNETEETPEDFFLMDDLFANSSESSDDMHDFFSGEEMMQEDELFLQEDALLNNTLVSQETHEAHDDLVIPENPTDNEFAFGNNDELAEIGALLNADLNTDSLNNNDDMLALLEGIPGDETLEESQAGDFDIFAMDSIDEEPAGSIPDVSDTAATKEQDDDVLFANPQMMTGPLEQNGVNEKRKKEKKVKEKKVKEKKVKEKRVKEKKVKEKKVKEKKTKGDDSASQIPSNPMFPDQTGLEIETLFEGDSIDDIQEKPQKKSGFFAKITEALFTEYEDDDSANEKGKKKKGKKNKDSDESQAVSDENTDILRELDEEDENDSDNLKKKKGKKDKKKKTKDKPEKKQKEADRDDGKKLPIKKIAIILFVAVSLMVIIILVAINVPVAIRKQAARRAYYTDCDYKKAYKELKGLDLNKSDKILLDKISTLLRVETKLDTYELHMHLGERLEALDSLFDGVIRYRNMCDKAEEMQYNISDKLDDIYVRILEKFEKEFNLTENDVNEVLTYEDDVIYTKILHSVIEGNGIDIFSQKVPDEPINSNNSMNNTDGLENVLPGEQDAIDQVNDYINNL